MKKIIQSILLLILTISCDNTIHESKSVDKVTADTVEIIQKPKEKKVNIPEVTLKSTVSITMQDINHQTLALGSGVIIGKGKVITNLHVIANAKYGFINVTSDHQNYYIDGYTAIDKINDLALLAIRDLNNSDSLLISESMPTIGDEIYAAGNPKGLVGTFSDGIVSAIRKFDGKSLIQITAPISPGSSGGPIVNTQAELIGIAVGGITDGQNLNFAIPNSYLIELLHSPQNLTSLNYKRASKPTHNEKVKTDLTKSIKVRNLIWSYGYIQNPTYGPLKQFSIFNNLDYPITDIQLFFILYDRSKIPVDYEFWTIRETVLPHLAKRIKYVGDRDEGFIYKEEGEAGYRLEIRVLDFKFQHQ
jgi:S1-C subfamily serine protease